YGFGFYAGAGLVCNGLATAPCRFAEYNAVQESPGPNYLIPTALITDRFTGAASKLNCRFTDFSSMAQDSRQLYIATVPVNWKDCQLHGGKPWITSSLNLTNCLMERVNYLETALSTSA